MKDYMVTHTFKSEEVRGQYLEMMKDIDADTIRSQMKNLIKMNLKKKFLVNIKLIPKVLKLVIFFILVTSIQNL